MPPSEQAWIDPRRWATLVRAYALFLMLAALSSYNATWKLVLERWMFSPAEGQAADIWLQPMKVALFLLPFIASQLLTALWLLAIGARRPDARDPAYRIAKEVLDDVRPRGGYRSVRFVVGAVAQPYLVSVLGKPFLVLPRQGLRYFQSRAGVDAEQSFRAVIAHEAGHIESWDDLLFLPSFSYIVAALGLCGFGMVQAAMGRSSLSAVLAQLLSTVALAVLGSYVIRRREAYSDSFSVIALRSVEATRQALASLQKEAGSRSSWLTTHFDVHGRLELLARRGRPFLEMTRYDLAITAFIYLNLGNASVAGVAAGAGVVWTFALWVDTLMQFVLIWLLLLMVAGAALARRGEPMPWRDLLVAAALSIAASSFFTSMHDGVFSIVQIGMMLFATAAAVVVSAVPFMLVMLVLNRWAVAILGRRDERDPRERLVWAALLIAAAFTLPQFLYHLGGAVFVRNAATSGAIETVGRSTDEMVTMMTPMFLMVGAVVGIQIGLAAAIAIWSIRRARSIPDMQCPSCGMTFFPRNARYPIALSCPRCESILRPDLLMQLEPAGATS